MDIFKGQDLLKFTEEFKTDNDGKKYLSKKSEIKAIYVKITQGHAINVVI